jgi:CRP-like cAMP-binding protein
MMVHKLLTNSRFIETCVGNILIGVPSDILKKIGSNEQTGIPTILVQPDLNHIDGIPQFAPEFPLYYFLFVGNNLFKKRFILLMKDEEEKQKEIETLTHMLPGPSLEYLLQHGVEKHVAENLRREMDYMALKKDEYILRIEDMIEFLTPDEGHGYTITQDNDKLRINRLGENRFEIIENQDHRSTIEIGSEYELPIKINYQLSTPYIAPVFGLVNLGSRSGFDPDSYTTTMVLSINGVMGLLDGSAYVFSQMNHFGLSFEDIKYIFLTHTHDDHCNLTPIIVSTARKIPIITTRDIYESAIVKVTSILGNLTSEQFRQQFPLMEVEAGYDEDRPSIELYGARIYAHRTIHSIPCIGFTIHLKGETLFVSGDTLSPKKIEAFRNEGAVSEKRADYLISKLNEDYSRALIDGGGGVIHGDPDEFKAKRGLHIVHINPKSIEDSMHNLLDAGQILEIIPTRQIDENIAYQVMKILSTLGITIFDPWMKVFLNSGKLLRSHQYEFLALEGEEDEGGFFLVLSGEVEVISGKKRVATYRQGSFFGELALLEEIRGHRQAGIRISSITALLWEIPDYVFQSFIKSSGRRDDFYDIRNKIVSLRLNKYLRGVSGEAMTTLARKSRIELFKSGEEIPQEHLTNNIILLNKGKVELIGKEKKWIVKAKDGSMEAELTQSLVDGNITKISIIDESCLTFISKKAFEKILKAHPGLGYAIRQEIKIIEELGKPLNRKKGI